MKMALKETALAGDDCEGGELQVSSLPLFCEFVLMDLEEKTREKLKRYFVPTNKKIKFYGHKVVEIKGKTKLKGALKIVLSKNNFGVGRLLTRKNNTVSAVSYPELYTLADLGNYNITTTQGAQDFSSRFKETINILEGAAKSIQASLDTLIAKIK